MKRSLSPRLGRGCHQARADLQPEQTLLVIPGGGWPWAGAIPPMPAPFRAMAISRGAENREGSKRGMAGAEGDHSIVGAESRLGISG